MSWIHKGHSLLADTVVLKSVTKGIPNTIYERSPTTTHFAGSAIGSHVHVHRDYSITFSSSETFFASKRNCETSHTRKYVKLKLMEPTKNV